MIESPVAVPNQIFEDLLSSFLVPDHIKLWKTDNDGYMYMAKQAKHEHAYFEGQFLLAKS
jgi:hypothetical protein